MGTRGVYGFRLNGKDKTTYNHSDSYPEYLGRNIIEFIRSTSSEEMKSIFNRIELIDKNKKPTKEEIAKCQEWSDFSVSSRSENDWYCLLRSAQGDLFAYKQGLFYMSDDSSFIEDSLFCEWGYIINLDTDMLEIWQGFQHYPDLNNRYGQEAQDEYYPCKMIGEFPLNAIDEWEEFVQTGMEEE